MTALFHFLQAQPFIALFAVVALGMILGRPAIRGISLGSVVCIVFVGLMVSIGSYRSTGTALALPDVIKTIFFNIFIFSMGMKIGPQFFAGLQRDGWHMVTIGLIAAVLAPATSYFFGWLFDLPAGAVAGLMAGSNNSSATFGTASAALQSGAFQPPPGVTADQVAGMLSASFALCYSVSQVQFVLFMKLLPTLARLDAPKAAREFENGMRAERTSPLPGTVEAADAIDASVAVRAYRVSEATLAGKTIGDVRRRAPGVAIELVRRGADWLDIGDATALAAGDEVVVSAPLDKQVRVREVLGPEVPDVEARALRQVHTVDVVVAKKDAAGRSLPDLIAWAGGGLYPNAVFRAGIELPAGAATTLAAGDVIRVTGTDAHIAELGTRVGHVVRASHASSLLTLAIGLVVGALLGAIPVPLPGFGISITFGATAVLMTGILFGWVKTRHPAFGGQISEGARSLMEEMGLNTFTSALAINSGLAVYQVATTGPIWQLLIASQFVSLVPPLVAWWIGRHLLHLNPALLMGAVAGARQNTTSMRAAQKESRSAVPGIGYPVPLAVATIALSVMGYFFALFA
jgi:putative transport protein